MEHKKTLGEFSGATVLKFICFSLVGLFVFFVQYEIYVWGVPRNSITVDHVAWFLRGLFGQAGAAPGAVRWVALAMIIYGCIRPFVLKTWNKGASAVIFQCFRLLGLVFAILFLTGTAPDWLMSGERAGNMLPFLFNNLAVMLTFLIPLGAFFLVFLTSFGLMEFIGVFARPLMRRVYRVPGRAAIDAVGSFVGSYAIALLITDKQYREKFYTKREAVIIATGFSTVSAAFVLVVARTLDIMDYWNLFFWTSLVITFLVTIVTARAWPVSRIPNEYIDGSTEPYVEPVDEHGGIIKTGLFEAFSAAERTGGFLKTLGKGLIDGINLSSGFIPTILSIGLVGLLLVEFTPVFDIMGYLFLPFTWLISFLIDVVPMDMARAVSTSLAEMLLPAVLATEMSLAARYVVGVVCVSSILFFSACIPCIKGTSIPVSVWQLVVVWIWRVILSILIAGVFAAVLF